MNVFPNEIRIKVIDHETKLGVPNIAVFIKLFATRKNDYFFILPISDVNGMIEITKDWLTREIKISSNLFLMDYASSLEDCYMKFELIILDSEAIKRAVKTMTFYKKYTNTSQEFIEAIEASHNYKYKGTSKVFEVHGEKEIDALIEAQKAGISEQTPK